MTHSRSPFAVLGLVAALGVSGCGAAPAIPTATSPPVAVPTAAFEPFSPAVDAARSTVASRLAASGFVLAPPVQAYEPGQPPALQATPKAVYRIDLIDLNQGWVVIYDLGSAEAASRAAADFGTYLRTFGHANYPADAEFTLNVVGGALVFHWWSAQRTSDPARAAHAFTIVSGVGQRIQVID